MKFDIKLLIARSGFDASQAAASLRLEFANLNARILTKAGLKWNLEWKLMELAVTDFFLKIRDRFSVTLIFCFSAVVEFQAGTDSVVFRALRSARE